MLVLSGGPTGPSCWWYIKNSGVNESPIENGTRSVRAAGTFGLKVIFEVRAGGQPISPVALTLNAMIKPTIILRFMIPSALCRVRRLTPIHGVTDKWQTSLRSAAMARDMAISAGAAKLPAGL
jgi:hypothetical protein